MSKPASHLILSELTTFPNRPQGWILPVILFAALVYGVLKLKKPGWQFGTRELKWTGLFLLLVLPFNLANFKLPFDARVLTLSGEFVHPVVPLLALAPAIVALGVAGPLPGVILAFVSGVLQAVIGGQDIMLAFVYTGMVMAFAWLISRDAQKDAGLAGRHPAVSVFLAFAFVIPLIFVIQLTHAVVYAQRDLLTALGQGLALVLCQVPAAAISAGAVAAVLRWLPAEWRPLDYLRDNGKRNLLAAAIEMIQALANGDYDKEIMDTARTEGENELFNSLESLRKNLQLRSDTQARLLSLDPSHYSREGYDLVLSSILRAALTRDASSARMVLLERRHESDRPEMRLRLGQGDNTRLYAYLDVIILEKIGDQDHLIINDLKVDQYFGLTPGTPYPQSIVALQLKNKGSSQGVLWVGFEQNHWFSQEDVQFYQQLAFRASAALSTKEQFSQVQTDKSWLEDTLNALPDPVYIQDKDGRLVFINQPGANLAGADENLLTVQKGRKTLTHKELLGLIKSAKEKPQHQTMTLNGGREFEANVYPLRNEKEVIGKAVFLRDNAWLKQLNSQKTEFVTNISHDLRSPLKLMKGYTRLLTNIGNLSEEQKKYVSRIEGGIENMSRLVNKVLNLERLDVDDLVLYNTFDIKEMVEETISMLDLQAQQRKVTLHTDFGGMQTPYISADRVLLQQAMYNLVENAIKFSLRGGAVLITAEKDSSWMHISVQDHGKGIAPLDQPKLFTRFFHVDEEDSYENRGQGLGLAIVKSIADKHGGTVSVRSQLGEGSTFYLDIPLHKL